jgi:hypothetical protein
MTQYAHVVLLSIFAIGGCGIADSEHEPAFYSTRFDIGTDGDFGRAGQTLKAVIEDQCGLQGHERPIYKVALGGGEYFLLFESHSLDGKLRTGATMHTSTGKNRQIIVDLFLSGFEGADEASACRNAIESRIQNLAVHAEL